MRSRAGLKTSLKATKSLSSITVGLKKKPKKPTILKTRKSPKKLEQKTAQELIKVADKHFSQYVRIRDSELVGDDWVGTCITCPRKMVVYSGGKWITGAQNGHMIGRGVFSLRYDEENCNLQCAHCNAWLDKDEMIERYRGAVDDKYGIGTYKKLKARSKLPDALKRPSKPDLLQVVHDSKTAVDYYLI